MKKYLPLLLAVTVIVALGATGDESANESRRLMFAHAGFSIAPLQAEPADQMQEVLRMYLPARNGLAPNVGVMIQPYDQSMDAYVNLTRGQFKDVGWQVLDEEYEGDTATWSYRGSMQGHRFRWYARAEKRGDHVYLITATCPQSAWEDLREQLTACVDSFQLEDLPE